MTRLLELLISMAIVAVLFLIVGAVLPSSRTLTETVETNRKMTIVYDTLNSMRRFDDWHDLALYDPNMTFELSGPESGVGARLDYSSDNPQVGSGSWEIVESVPNERIVYDVRNSHRGDNKRYEILLEPTGRSGRNVQITQKYRVDYGWDLLGRYSGLYVARNVGDSMERSLGRLTNMLATVPNVDYRVEGSKLTGLAAVDRPAEHLLVVPAGAVERNNEKIKESMKSNMEWIKRTLDANGLVAAGPMRIVSTELGRENYTFDVAQPVRRRGTGEAAADDAGDDGDEPAPQALASADEPLEGLELLGPVVYTQVPPTRAAKAEYTGFMAELDNVRNALRAWAVTQGYEVTDRPYEVYENGIDKAFTAEGEYEVYWTIKGPKQ
ncbi:polyketide cyclase [Luteimonas vadosa]|uniref:SRPBCC family protein n=1 Tax=Luteimonas vadosa TaxID=1165507 RepID=A0ABP9E1M1_9GAMM